MSLNPPMEDGPVLPQFLPGLQEFCRGFLDLGGHHLSLKIHLRQDRPGCAELLFDVPEFGGGVPHPPADLFHLRLEPGPFLPDGLQSALAFLDLPLQIWVLGGSWLGQSEDQQKRGNRGSTAGTFPQTSLRYRRTARLLARTPKSTPIPRPPNTQRQGIQSSWKRSWKTA